MQREFEKPGISTEEMEKLRVWYPSMRAVKGHSMGNGNYRVIIVDLIGVRSHAKKTKLKYRLLIDLEKFPAVVPVAYVLSPNSEKIEHVNIGYGERTHLAPNRSICRICLGSIDAMYEGWAADRLARMRGYLNHLENILNTPNTSSRMRG